MPEKKSPWKRPKKDDWIKVGKKLVYNNGKPPRQAPCWVVTNIETTGNGCRMIHMALVDHPETTTAKWESEILGRDSFLHGVCWMPAPPPPRPPRPKKERKSRFEREYPI